jgi:hypothetical protein
MAKLRIQITAGRVQATISDSSPAIITFSDDLPAAPHSAVNQLHDLNSATLLLQHHLEMSSREMGMNQKYLQKVGISRELSF